jgi:hypothetical protein
MTTIIRTAFLLLGIAASAQSAFANNLNCRWLGNGGDNKWSTAANWDMCNNGVPGNNDSVIFINTAKRGTNVNDLVGLQLVSVGLVGQPGDGTPGNPLSAWAISGNPISISSGITASSLRTIAGVDASFLIPVTLGAAATFRNQPIAPGDTSTRLVLGNITLNGKAATFAIDFPITVAGAIAGAGSISKQLLGALTLNENTYTGTTDIVAGTVIAASGNALGSSALQDSTTIENNAYLTLNNGVSLNEPVLFVNGNLLVPAGVTATLAGPVNAPPPVGTPNNAFLAIDGALTISGRVIASDTDVIFLRGAGTLTLTNNGNVWGSMLVQSGTVKTGVARALPQGKLNLLGDLGMARLDLNGFDQLISSLSGGANSLITLGANKLTIDQADDATFSGSIVGTGTFVKQGAKTLTMSGNVGASPTIINGTLAEGADDRIDDNTPVIVKTPGMFLLNGHKDTIGAISGDGTINIGLGTLTVNASGASSTFDGPIFGDPAPGGRAAEVYFRLIKTGGGTLTLTSPNTRLSDQFVVDFGTLALDGKIIGSGGILRGGTLAGSGTVFDNNGLYTFTSFIQVKGGAISPGHSPGILHGDAAEFAQNGTYVVELNGLTPGIGYDQLALNNGLTFLDNTAQLLVTRGFPVPQGSAFTIVSMPAGVQATGTFAGLPEGGQLEIDKQKFSITYRGGTNHNNIVLTALEGPPPITYLLSEGATGSFFDEDILIANPNGEAATVTLTFSKENGQQVVNQQTLAPQSRLTVHVDQIPGLEATAASAQITSEKGLPLVVERSMFWDQTHYAGSTGSSVDKPGADWFFAEGSQGFFQTFVLVINPNPTPADVTFTFFREQDTPVTKTIRVGATTRLTLDCGSIPEIVDRSFGISVHGSQPIMAERSMYFGTTASRLWSGGTESAGVKAPSTHWFLAEGATGGFFTTFVLMSNPQTIDAHVTLQYLLTDGQTVTRTKVIAAGTRLTTNIQAEDDTRLQNTAMSTVVTSDVPIIAERSMYWLGAAIPWGEGHNSFGVVDADVKWGLAEGRTGGPFNYHTYILLANPQTTAAQVQITLLRENGAPVVKTYTVAPTSRFNIDSASIAELHDESLGAVVEVTNGVPIIVERSMYWDANGFQFSGGTNATGIKLP